MPAARSWSLPCPIHPLSLILGQVFPEQAIKDPFVLEFLGLKDEYSESDLEEALINRLETFLLELGGDFCFIGRQRRLRVGNEWYRVDLLFFHRRLRCLVIIDLKLGKFTHADAGQMHLYLNYAREHWMQDGENPPVGLILCSQKDEAVARYALFPSIHLVSSARAKSWTPLPALEWVASIHPRDSLRFWEFRFISCFFFKGSVVRRSAPWDNSTMRTGRESKESAGAPRSDTALEGSG